jgi:N-(2-amino-2-carboxyethyl)-L-glutamate synthase
MNVVFGEFRDGIGRTPMRQVELTIRGVPRLVHLKLEGENPGGSIKDRTAHGLVTHLEHTGALRPGQVLIDSTSGNLGVALAMIAQARGYGFLAVVDPKTTDENLAKMRRFGAQIEIVQHMDPQGGYLFTRLQRVLQLCQSPEYVWTDQYSSPANPRAHYDSTAPEILADMAGQVDVVFVAVSTGGTLAGIGRYFREHSPSTRVVGVDARGSVVFGGAPGPRLLTGIGSSQQSRFLEPGHYDEHHLVGDEEAFTFCRAVYSATDIKLGGSSGAVLAACGRYLARHPHALRVVCICPDRGENYNLSIFNDEWLRSRGLNVSRELLGAVSDIAPAGTRPHIAPRVAA